ncbi:MAG: carbonic anhydrase [Methanimicrococcus sp.]|nr:carbonic anhydrase [Methanimicrococcus sp.]
MPFIKQIMEFNKNFVDNKQYEAFDTTKYPNKKIAILSCMDTRLTELLPAALNLKNGDAKIIKNAGAMITHPYGSVMRSLLVAIYELGIQEILVIAHHDCGMQGLKAPQLIKDMMDRNITQDKIDLVQNAGIDIHEWLHGFENTETSVAETVKIIKTHPLMPPDVNVYGFIIDPKTGKLDRVE